MKIKKIKDYSDFFIQSIPYLKHLPFPNVLLMPCYILDMYKACNKYGLLMEDYMSLGFWEVDEEKRCEYLTTDTLFSEEFKEKFYEDDAFNLIMNKCEFNKAYAKFLKREWICTSESDEEIVSFLNKYEKVIMKPIQDSCGRGIRIINSGQVEYIINEKKQNHYNLLEQVLVNHPVIRDLNPTSLQTLRVETCIDKDGVFHVLNCCLMIGAPNSHVSNCHGGGTMWHVNLKTGVVDSWGYNPEGWYVKRLKNGREVYGLKIPHFDMLHEMLEEVANVTPGARYIGWDVAILNDGFAIIEGNTQPGLCTQRVDGIPKKKILEKYA